MNHRIGFVPELAGLSRCGGMRRGVAMTTDSRAIDSADNAGETLGLKRSSRLAAANAASRGCDPRAREVAMAVYEAVRPSMVILFGSRARGDYHDDSDIDLLVITGMERADNDGYVRASRAARQKACEVYGHSVSVDVLHHTGAEFADRRRAKNHVAGQAVRDGVDQTGAKLSGRYQGEEPTNWPDIRQRIANAERNLSDMAAGIDANQSQEAIGFFAQQAVENALKGWISALDDSYTNTHEIEDLTAIVRRYPQEISTSAGERLVWLTKYAVEYRYEGAVIEMVDRSDLLAAVSGTVNAILHYIRELTGSE